MKPASPVKPFKCVVIGGSWGGIDAVGKVLMTLPVNFPLPIVVVLHQHRKHESHIPEIFRRKCVLQVKEADEKEMLVPGNVYIAPPNYHLLIERDGSLSLTIDEHVNFSRPSIDVTFATAAESYQDELIGILLTGANHDGAEGVFQIKRFGGLVLVEDPATAEAPVMPQSAIDKTRVDQILPLAELSEYLLAITVGSKKGA